MQKYSLGRRVIVSCTILFEFSGAELPDSPQRDAHKPGAVSAKWFLWLHPETWISEKSVLPVQPQHTEQWAVAEEEDFSYHGESVTQIICMHNSGFYFISVMVPAYSLIVGSSNKHCHLCVLVDSILGLFAHKYVLHSCTPYTTGLTYFHTLWLIILMQIVLRSNPGRAPYFLLKWQQQKDDTS